MTTSEIKAAILDGLSTRVCDGLEDIVEKVYGSPRQGDEVYQAVGAAVGELLAQGEITRHKLPHPVGYVYKRAAS